MKKLFLFLAMASTTMFVSCGSDDSDSTPVNPPVEEATAITLSANATTVQVGTAVTFTVKNNLVPAVDVTSSSTFTANNVAFNGPTFTSSEAGTFTVVAKNGTLTSAAVVITVTPAPVEAEENSIFINGENYDLENSILVYYGGWAEDPNATQATHGLWSMLTFDGDGSALEENYIDVEFLTAVTGGQVPFPDSTNGEFLDIYEAIVGGEEVEFTSQEGGTLTLENFPDAINMPHAFSATANYNAGSTLQVNFDGNWLGFDNQGPAPEARPASKTKRFINMSSSNKVLSKREVAKLKSELKSKVFTRK